MENDTELAGERDLGPLGAPSLRDVHGPRLDPARGCRGKLLSPARRRACIAGSAELQDDGSLLIMFEYHLSDEAVLKAVRDPSSTAC